MTAPAPPWLGDVPEILSAPLSRCAAGDLPVNVALMQLLGHAADEAEAERALVSARAVLDQHGDAEAATRVAQILALWRANPQAWALVKTVLGEADHEGPGGDSGMAVDRWTAVFDRLARKSPGASVALYSLGRPELLDAATAELVQLVRCWGMLGQHIAVLDVGCGIGRISAAIASEAASVVGVDVSEAMIVEARRRCAALANVSFMRTSGRDLAELEDSAFDLVLAIDVFPYLVNSGPGLAARHVEEAARVMRPGGSLLIFNYSYRGDLAADRADLARLARLCGLSLLRNGSRELKLWDGAAFQLSKTAAAGSDHMDGHQSRP